MTKARDIADFKFENIVDTGTEGLTLPKGTTAQRGSTEGQIRYNTETDLAEYYDGISFKPIDAPPIITSISPSVIDSDDGSTTNITITGQSFSLGATVKAIGANASEISASSVTRNSQSELVATFTNSSFLNAQEPYDIKVINSSGLSATLDNQINVDVNPVWTTASGNIATISDNDTGTHVTVAATDADSDSITYALASGNSLPSGLSLNSSSGAISGDSTDVQSSTTTSFNLEAQTTNGTTSRSFNIIVNPSYDGSSSGRAAGSPYQIATVTGTTPSNGVYWFQNSGYNSGNPFQAYADWSISNYSTNGIMIVCQQDVNGMVVNNFTDLGTASTGTSGTRGHGNTFREPAATILSNWSGDTANRGIVGQYREGTGSSLGTASYSLWIEISKSPSVFKTMFDNVPSGGEFTGTISARSVGGTGSFYWSRSSSGEYPNHLQMSASGTNDTWNQGMYIEYRQAGSDTNHSFHIAPDGNGSYANASSNGVNHYNGGSQNRTGWFGFSPNNVRT